MLVLFGFSGLDLCLGFGNWDLGFLEQWDFSVAAPLFLRHDLDVGQLDRLAVKVVFGRKIQSSE